MRFFRKKNYDRKIYPDEVFLDSENISGLDVNQFEGRIESPISKKTFVLFSAVLGAIGVFLLFNIFTLQITRGGQFAARSEKNIFKKEKIIPLRGVIYDKNGIALAWNGEVGRAYASTTGLSHVLGYVGLPAKKDFKKTPDIGSEEIVGKDGVEKKYNEILRGTAGIKLTERDSQGDIISENTQTFPENGRNLTLTIDSKIQTYLFKMMEEVIKERDFEGGAAVIMDVNNGSILAMANVPEYSSEVLSGGGPSETIASYVNNKNKPFLNRAISGLYPPGSTIKPLIAIAALNEGTISPDKQILSAGSISIPNPFFADKKTVFKDWKAHGWVNMRKAIAVSSDVYFYEIGGGFEGIKGLGIKKINEYANKFGLNGKTGIDLPGESEGVAPSPELKAENNPSDPVWRAGDTYITSIGQGYFLSTPIGIAVYMAAVANGGAIVRPHVAAEKETAPISEKTVNIPESYFKVAREGMRMVVTEGTAQSFNFPNLKIAAKTGTAEVGSAKKFIHSWLTGFYPYENPKYAFVMVLEKGRSDNTVGAPYAMKRFFEWLNLYYPE